MSRISELKEHIDAIKQIIAEEGVKANVEIKCHWTLDGKRLDVTTADRIVGEAARALGLKSSPDANEGTYWFSTFNPPRPSDVYVVAYYE